MHGIGKVLFWSGTVLCIGALAGLIESFFSGSSERPLVVLLIVGGVVAWLGVSMMLVNARSRRQESEERGD